MDIFPIIPHDNLPGVHQDVNTTASPSFVDLTLTAATQDYKFSGAGVVLTLQAQTSAQTSALYFFGKDGDGTDSITSNLYGVGTPGSIGTSEYLVRRWNTVTNKYEIGTGVGVVGGTVRPLSLFTGDNADQILLNTDGTVGIGDISGDFTVATTDFKVDTVVHKIEIGSTDGSDKIQIYHDNSNTYFRTTDGVFIWQTDEGDNTQSKVEIRGKGTGSGELVLTDQDNAEWLYFTAWSGKGLIRTMGTTPAKLQLQDTAHAAVSCFENAAEGETQELQIYGFGTGSGGKESLDISVEQYAANTAEFYGVPNFLFSGKICFTQTDLNEAITGALNDGYLDYLATTGHRFDRAITINGVIKAASTALIIPSGKGAFLKFNSAVDYGSLWCYDYPGSAYKPIEIDASYIMFQISGVEKARLSTGGEFTTPAANTKHIFGRGQLGYGVDSATFGYRGFGATNFAIMQGSDFATYIKAAAAKNITFYPGNSLALTLASTGTATFGSTVDAIGGFKDNGVAGIDGSWVNAEGDTVTVSGGIITAITAP